MPYIQTRKASDGKTRYRAMVRLKGHPAQTATFRRKSDAKIWAQQTETAIRERRYFKTTEATRHTLSELVERYVDQVLPAREERGQRLVAKQLRWWSERLGCFTLADVTPALIAEHRDELARGGAPKGRPVTPATQNRYLQALSHAFTIAVREWGWISENPVRSVRRLREPRGRVRFLSDDERSNLLAVCRESRDPRLYPLVLLAVSTGARSGELMALRWSAVDLERGVAVLHKTKNGERRAIPLAGPALEELIRLSEKRSSGDALLFPNAQGQPIFPRLPWEDALEEAGLEDFRFHDLRHTAASYLAMSGATLAEIAEILGHKTLAMVKRYAHLTDAHTRSVVERMNQQFLRAG